MGNGQALLGMPELKTLDMITISCNIIDTQEANRADKCSTNTANCQGSRHYKHSTHMMQAQKCYTNIYSNSKSNTKDRPIVIGNKNS